MKKLSRTVALAVLVAAGCRPDFGLPLSRVTRTRLIAVRGQPAEAAPGATVKWDALVVSPDGTVAAPAIDWGFCNAPKPPGDNEVVPPSCVTIEAVTFVGATGPTVSAPLPDDACRLFGPDVPPQAADGGVQRPRDPDDTGGYYQPVRAALDADVSYGLERLRCNLAGASIDLAQAYAMRYQENRNPTLVAPVASLPLDRVPPGARVTLTAGWTAGSAETFPVLDAAAQALVDRRESLTVSFFASDGSFATERSGRDESDPSLSVDDVWTAPSTPGPVHLWLVLRDSRGGVDWASFDANVTRGSTHLRFPVAASNAAISSARDDRSPALRRERSVRAGNSVTV